MSKIRLLGIVPYESLITLMKHTVKNYKDISLDIYNGNLEHAVDIARQYGERNYDAIISRGQTAALLKEYSDIPVFDIPISFNDLLQPLQMALVTTHNIAIVGYSSLTKSIYNFKNLLSLIPDSALNIITINHNSDILPELTRLKAAGCDLILGDVAVTEKAEQMGFKALLVNSGPDSLTHTFDEIVNFFNYCSNLKHRNHLLENALECSPATTIIMDNKSNLIYSSLHFVDIQDIIEYLQTLIKNNHPLSNSKSFHYIKDVLYSITVKQELRNEAFYYIFCVESTPIPHGSSKYGLKFLNLPNVRYNYKTSIFSLTAIAHSLDQRIRQLNQTKRPIMILGERGTAKNTVAGRLYMESEMNNAPFVQIDCVLINSKMWDFLLKHYNSPFCDSGNTIYINNIQALEPTKRQTLLSMFMDTNAHKRNRVIFSCSETLSDPHDNPSRDFIDYLPCSTLYLPPLREFPEDIISASTLYLHYLNQQSLRQILGFENEATQLMINYNWPDNFFQLKRVVTELSLLTETPYISKELVQEILDKEAIQYIAEFREESSFNYDRPLNEIIHEIVEVVLARCDGNQTKAAKQLGIGRTTLWRYLNPDAQKASPK